MIIFWIQDGHHSYSTLVYTKMSNSASFKSIERKFGVIVYNCKLNKDALTLMIKVCFDRVRFLKYKIPSLNVHIESTYFKMGSLNCFITESASNSASFINKEP